MNHKKIIFRCFALIGVLGMSWFHTLLQAAGIPGKPPLAKVQELFIGNLDDPQSLDPHKTMGSSEAKIIADLLEGLYVYNNQGNVVPGISVFSYTNDQMVWTFYLRPGVRWSNGEPLTAEDFVYSWQRLADPQTASSEAGALQAMGVKNIDEIVAGKLPPSSLGIKATGRTTLQIYLSKPIGFITKFLANPTLAPLHRATVTQYGDRWTLPVHWVGNGAYCLHERVINDKVVLTRNPHYWDNQHTTINRVTYLNTKDDDTEIAHYKTGGIDISDEIMEGTQLPSDLMSERRWLTSATINGYQFNTQVKPFNDVRVRQALNLTIDREKLFVYLGITGEVPAYNIVPHGLGGLPAFQPAWRDWKFEQRLATAKKLLQEAGFNEKNPLRFTLLYNDNKKSKLMATTVSALWQSLLGAKVTLECQEWKVYLDSKQERQFQMSRDCTAGEQNEAYSLLSSFMSLNCGNQMGYTNAEFDDCLMKAVSCVHDYERRPWYHRAEAILAAEVPLIPISHPRFLRLVKPYVGGLDPEDQSEFFYTKNLYIYKHK